MKVLNNVQIPRMVKNMALAAPLMFITPALRAQQANNEKDVFIKSQEICAAIEGKDSMEYSPEVKLGDDYIFPSIVVDLSEKRLYHYDYDGYLKDVYPIASGKKLTPTKPGLKIIADIEEYPYKNAYGTRRKRYPADYGTHLLRLKNVDNKTGEIIGEDGQYIHGTSKPNSIGKKVSKGCVRVYNTVIDTLANQLSKDQYVLIRE